MEIDAALPTTHCLPLMLPTTASPLLTPQAVCQQPAAPPHLTLVCTWAAMTPRCQVMTAFERPCVPEAFLSQASLFQESLADGCQLTDSAHRPLLRCPRFAARSLCSSLHMDP